MALSRVERAKITDSALKIQSAQASLQNLDDQTMIQDFHEIEDCLEMAGNNLRRALRENHPPKGGA
jgi:hypothetical protein